MKKIFIVFSLFFCVVISYSQEQENEIIGDIKLIKEDNFLNLKAQVTNNQKIYVDELTYSFITLKKSSKGNYFKNNQSGDFSLGPKEERYLSTVRVNLNEGEELQTFLFIKQNNKVLHRDTLFLNSKGKVVVNSIKDSTKEDEVDETEFMIKGVVLDEAITRIGKDFHDYFYKEYLISGRKYPFIIKVIEKPAMGSSSIIEVEVEGFKIHEFFAKPNEDYLKTNVAETMKNLTSYVKMRGDATSLSKRI